LSGRPPYGLIGFHSQPSQPADLTAWSCADSAGYPTYTAQAFLNNLRSVSSDTIRRCSGCCWTSGGPIAPGTHAFIGTRTPDSPTRF